MFLNSANCLGLFFFFSLHKLMFCFFFSFDFSGTGTFGRVHLVKEKMGKHYFALKVMSIPDVIRLKQEQHVHNEKSVLKEVNHPFLIRL